MVNKIKYQGHIIRDYLNDDEDTQRQCCKLYGQANMLACTFYKCTVDVKIAPLELTALLFIRHTYGVVKVKLK